MCVENGSRRDRVDNRQRHAFGLPKPCLAIHQERIPMNNNTKPQNGAQNNAQKYFKRTALADTAAKESKKLRKEGAAKIDRLRGLRLAKEAADKEEADKLAIENTGTVAPAKRKRTAAAKPAKMTRMTY